MTNVLLVTTTVGMVNRVHGDTTDTGPSVSLGLVLPEGATGLEEGLVGPLATGNNTNHGSAGAEDGLSDTGGKADSGLVAVLRVSNDDSGSTTSSGEGATVTVLGLNVGDDSAFGHHINGENVADNKGGLLSGVDVHSGVHAFHGNEILSALFVFVLVSEHNLSEGGTSASVVHDVSDHSTDVALSFSVVESSETCGGNSLAGVGLEDS